MKRSFVVANSGVHVYIFSVGITSENASKPSIAVVKMDSAGERNAAICVGSVLFFEE